jgi:hypothetical protein
VEEGVLSDAISYAPGLAADILDIKRWLGTLLQKSMLTNGGPSL